MTPRRQLRRPRLTRARLVVLGVTVIGVASVLVVASEWGERAADLDASAATGAGVLDIELGTFDGGRVPLATFSGGGPLVVNFFASWCGPCIREMPDFEAVHSRRDDVRFVGVSLQEGVAAATELVEETGVTYDVARDDDGELFRAVDGFSMPTTVFIDSNGSIVEVHGGALSQRDLEVRIDRLVDR